MTLPVELPIDLVVAADSALGIGKQGQIPWRLPGDMAHFKQITSTAAPGNTNAVLMGRKTWESIPERFRPLHGRINVVLSRRDGLALPPGVIHERSLADALTRLEQRADIDTIYIIGGGQIYAQALRLPACRNIYFTRVHGHFACDTFFPPFEDSYRLIDILAERRENDIEYRIEVWRNREISP